MNLPLHLVACKDINNARSGYPPLSHSLFQTGGACRITWHSFFMGEKVLSIKVQLCNCATVQQQQQVNVKTKQTDGINDDDDEKKEQEQEQQQEEKGRGNSALVPGQKIY